MKKALMITVFLFSIIFLPSFSGATESGGHFHIATCSGVIDGVDFTLDFFEEVHPTESNQPLGPGVVIQTMRKGENSAKFFGKIDVKASGSEERIITMYDLATSSVVFSQFQLNVVKNSTLEIFAKNFGAVWGTFNCTPGLYRGGF